MAAGSEVEAVLAAKRLALPPPARRRPPRARLVIAHRYVGLALILFLLMSGFTGALIAFEDELDRVLNPGVVGIVEPAKPLDPFTLRDRAAAAMPRASLDFLPLRRAEGASLRIFASSKGPAAGAALGFNQIFVDPANGRILGVRDAGAWHADWLHLLPFFYRLHYSLAAPGTIGVWIMGLVGLVWMVDCIVGLAISVPRGKPFRSALAIRHNKGAYKFNFDLHRAGGLILWPILFVIALSGWAINLREPVWKPMLSLFSPVNDDIYDRLPERAPALPRLGFREAFARAEQIAAHRFRGPLTPEDIAYIPERHVYQVGFLGPLDVDRERGRTRVYLDATSGRLLALSAPGGNAAKTVDAWMFPLHSGTFAGIWGRILVAFAGLFSCMLSITGFVIWRRKRAARLLADRKRGAR